MLHFTFNPVNCDGWFARAFLRCFCHFSWRSTQPERLPRIRRDSAHSGPQPVIFIDRTRASSGSKRNETKALANCWTGSRELHRKVHCPQSRLAYCGAEEEKGSGERDESEDDEVQCIAPSALFSSVGLIIASRLPELPGLPRRIRSPRSPAGRAL